VSALENRFRRIKGDAKALNDALAQGIDPITIPTDSLNGKIGKGRLQPKPVFHIVYKFHSSSQYAHIITIPQASNNAVEIAKYYGDCTASSLDHRFRPIKRDAQAMREGKMGTQSLS
jgi:hypothetical protein